MAQLQFDANNYEPSRPGIQQLPISDENGHLVTIVKSDVTATKDGQNGMLVLTYQIIEGEHSGASGVCRLNIYHQSEQTAEIAYKQLSAICHCTGVMQLADSSQLHNIPHRVLVRKQTNDDRYTEIYGWLHADGNLPGQGGAQAPQNNQPQDSNPWGGGSSLLKIPPPQSNRIKPRRLRGDRLRRTCLCLVKGAPLLKIHNLPEKIPLPGNDKL